ncbi:unnamed protein product [Closterium sp. Naga37s-1]|nr:unnamed protein product [Closterium sp. Naga37s-1]
MASSGKDKINMLGDAQVDQLDRDLREFRRDLGTLADKQIAKQHDAARRDSATVRTTQDKLNELRRLEQDFLAEEQSILKQQEEQQDDLDRQCEEMARLGLDKAMLVPQLEKAKDFVAELEADVQAEDEALENAEEVQQQRIDALLSVVIKFREAFGLRFDPTPGAFSPHLHFSSLVHSLLGILQDLSALTTFLALFFSLSLDDSSRASLF